jgi:hypothetical protein
MPTPACPPLHVHVIYGSGAQVRPVNSGQVYYQTDLNRVPGEFSKGMLCVCGKFCAHLYSIILHDNFATHFSYRPFTRARGVNRHKRFVTLLLRPQSVYAIQQYNRQTHCVCPATGKCYPLKTPSLCGCTLSYDSNMHRVGPSTNAECVHCVCVCVRQTV